MILGGYYKFWKNVWKFDIGPIFGPKRCPIWSKSVKTDFLQNIGSWPLNGNDLGWRLQILKNNLKIAPWGQDICDYRICTICDFPQNIDPIKLKFCRNNYPIPLYNFRKKFWYRSFFRSLPRFWNQLTPRYKIMYAGWRNHYKCMKII